MKRPWSLMRGGEDSRRPHTHRPARPGTDSAWAVVGPLALAGERAGMGPASPALRSRNGRAKRALDAIRGDARVSSARSASRLLLQHPLRRQRAGLASQLVQDPGTVRPGHENARHEERLSVLLRNAGPEHDRRIEPPLVAAGPLLPGAGASVASRSACTTASARTCRSTTSTRSPRARALSVSRSISTGCTAAEAVTSENERRSLLGGLGHERLNPRDHVFGLGRQAVENHRVGPELPCAVLDEFVVLLVGAEPAKPANQRRRRIDFEDPRTLGEVFVRHLQDAAASGCSCPLRR